jgi:hypothetical protein
MILLVQAVGFDDEKITLQLHKFGRRTGQRPCNGAELLSVA